MVATPILGLAWGIWHIPLYGPLGFVVPLVLAFFYIWLYNRTGSVLLCILLHASFTPAQNHLILLPDTVVLADGPANTIGLVTLGTYGRCYRSADPHPRTPGRSRRPAARGGRDMIRRVTFPAEP